VPRPSEMNSAGPGFFLTWSARLLAVAQRIKNSLKKLLNRLKVQIEPL
jgi:hypothetical protein